ncbi:dynamin family protein [Kitasatospora purpeofusca]|uniref:dynamin family protein n=1 Tax=Kitasatospora purpeofusca TaxID=67352 RepID=UPI0036D430F5
MKWDDPVQALRFAQEVKEVAPDPLDVPEEAADDFRDALHHTEELIRVATTPVAIGVVGEFTAGKSSLIGALLGKPDLLPTANRATTAQVTALRLRGGPPDRPTALGDRAVAELLSPADVLGCLVYMANELSADFKREKEGLDRKPLQEFLTAIATPATDATPLWRDPRTWQRFDTWAREALWTHPQDNETLRESVREMHRLSEALLTVDPDLFGSTVGLSTAVARALADMGKADDPGAPYPARSPLRKKLDRQSLEAALEHASRTGTALGEEYRAVLSPLIRRIDVDVDVRPGTWETVDSQDGGALLLDFPGLGAAGRRDDYLCLSQLKNVETILVVSRGNLMGSRLVGTFYGKMESQGHGQDTLADSILMAFNKWDTTSAPELPAEVVALGATATAASEALHMLRVDAAKLLFERIERALPVSVLAAVATEGSGLDCTLADLSPMTPDEVKVMARRRREWGELANRIAVADPGHPWVRQLGEYARDGGLLALRAMIAEHIEEHGVRLKRRTVGEQFRRTHRAWRTVDARTRAHTVAEGSPEHAELIERFERLGADAGRLMTALNELRNPAKARQGSGGSVLARLERQAVTAVFSWPLWGELFAAVEDGVVTKAPVSSVEVPDYVRVLPPHLQDEFRKNLAGQSQDRDADTTTAFHRHYLRTVTALREDALKQLTAWAESWAAEQEEVFGEVHAWLADEETGVRLEGLFAQLPESRVPPSFRVSQLRVLTTTAYFPPTATAAATTSAAALAPADITGFPQLADHVLPWSHDYPDDPSPKRREAESSQYVVALFRSRLVAAVYEQAAAAFTDMLAAALTGLIQLVQQNARAVPDSLQVAEMISAGAAAADGGEAGDGSGTAGQSEENGSLRAVLRRWEQEK